MAGNSLPNDITCPRCRFVFEQQLNHARRAAIAGFITGFAVGAYLIWHLIKL
jgi:hypothetical protein